MGYKLKAGWVTDIGIIKPVNEDSCICKVIDNSIHAGVFAVADGVGGLPRGELASAIAISNLNDWYRGALDKNYSAPMIVCDELSELFEKTNRQLMEIYHKEDICTATTLSAMLILKDTFIYSHIGDCRIYRIRNNVFRSELERITSDQTAVVDKLVNGKPSKKVMLTDCLGFTDTCNNCCGSGLIKRNEIYLICSDGVYKTISDDVIRSIVRRYKNDMNKICKELVKTAKTNRETDNISVIAVKII